MGERAEEKRGTLVRRLEIYGATHLGGRVRKDDRSIDVREVVRILYWDEGMSMAAMVRTFNASERGMYDLFKRLEVRTRESGRTKWESALEVAGYPSGRHFFAAHSDKSFSEMGKVLGLNRRTVSKYYKIEIQGG